MDVHSAVTDNVETPASLTPEQMKHLDFIQSTIARHVTHAFAIKGWSLTVSGAIFAYAAGNLHPWLAAVALLPPVAFAWLDLFYMRQVRVYEEFYRHVFRADTAVRVLDMDPMAYRGVLAHPKCTYRHAMTTSSWWVFHTLVIIIGLVLLIVSIFR